jgi:phosphate transport system protein
MSARPTFVYELEQLNIELIKMGAMVEQAIERSIKAFREQDHKLAQEIIQGDKAVDEMEKNIEYRCLSLILRQQPVASDLREVSAALKMVTDMERIGDHASDIAALVVEISGSHIFHIVEHIPEMAKVSIQMVHDAVKSFVDQNLDLARQVIQTDDVVDNLFSQVKSEVVGILKSSPEHSDRGVDFLMIAKYLERIADHAVNICEWVEFNRTGNYKQKQIL